MILFKDIPLHKYFFCDGDYYLKISSCTAKALEHGRVFRFSHNDHCKLAISK